MKLKDGKTYIDGRGKHVTVKLRPTGTATTYPFSGSNGVLYTETGLYIIGDNDNDHNLIEEVPE